MLGVMGCFYGVVIFARFGVLSSIYFSCGQISNIDFGIFTVNWVDWWVVILGLSFVITTLYAPKGIGGLVEIMFRKKQL